MAASSRKPRGAKARSVAVKDPPPDARERILRTSYELFRRNGVNIVGIDRIVAESGVAKTTLYRHFRSREDLVLAVLERHEKVWTWDWLEHEIKRRARTPEAQLLAVFDALDDWFHQPDFEGCLFTNSLLETHARASRIRSTSMEKLAIIRALLQRLAEEAGIRDPEVFARQIQMLMLGSIVAAVDGNLEAARQARVLAGLFLEQERAR
jgi:AcrR family transcriptional regulator